ncbi:MAG: hypothetical protein ABSE57_23805 [Bryobacteraceae bacterium]
MMWIRGTTSANCIAVGAANCANQSSFVYAQQIQFGNGTLAHSNTVTLGQCPADVMNSPGIVRNYVTDSLAEIAGSAQTNLQALWQVGNATTTPLTDGQAVYVVETYFQSPDLSVGSLSGNCVFARYFF